MLTRFGCETRSFTRSWNLGRSIRLYDYLNTSSVSAFYWGQFEGHMNSHLLSMQQVTGPDYIYIENRLLERDKKGKKRQFVVTRPTVSRAKSMAWQKLKHLWQCFTQFIPPCKLFRKVLTLSDTHYNINTSIKVCSVIGLELVHPYLLLLLGVTTTSSSTWTTSTCSKFICWLCLPKEHWFRWCKIGHWQSGCKCPPFM